MMTNDILCQGIGGKKMVISAVWIHVCPCLTSAFCSSLSLFFTRSAFRDKFYCSCTVHAFKNIKKMSHGTIHIFKN